MSATLNAYKGMTIRNIKIYMKDKTAILLSMLAQIIVLGLFVLFLRDNYVGSIKDGLGELQNLLSDSDIDKIVNGWMISGVIGTALVTVALNSLVVIVKDKEDKINYDYTASPVKPHTVVLSYFTASVINTFVVSAILMTAGFVFLGISCDTTYSPIEILKMYGLVALGSISSALILMVIATFFKKELIPRLVWCFGVGGNRIHNRRIRSRIAVFGYGSDNCKSCSRLSNCRNDAFAPYEIRR